MIIAAMATIPGREAACKRAQRSLEMQINNVYVVDTEIRGRMDDARKFVFGAMNNAYIFTCDDDLIYSPRYTKLMIDSIERYDRKAVITLHGGVVNPPIESYYNGGRDPKYSCLLDQDKDHRIHIPGTGVMAWHTDTIKFTLDDFPEQNMADIQAGIKCNTEGVPIICVAHRRKIVRHIETPTTIYEQFKDRDEVQTRLVNRTAWNPIPPS